jgi:hypothetical protein
MIRCPGQLNDVAKGHGVLSRLFRCWRCNADAMLPVLHGRKRVRTMAMRVMVRVSKSERFTS